MNLKFAVTYVWFPLTMFLSVEVFGGVAETSGEPSQSLRAFFFTFRAAVRELVPFSPISLVRSIQHQFCARITKECACFAI